MRKLLNMFKRDENAYSVGRIIAVAAFFLFAGISLYLAVLNRTWGGYDTFSLSCVVYMLTQLGNKIVELRGVKIGGKNGNE